jgi:glycosyltransferase involved in cell wall biosynthesis
VVRPPDHAAHAPRDDLQAGGALSRPSAAALSPTDRPPGVPTVPARNTVDHRPVDAAHAPHAPPPTAARGFRLLALIDTYDVSGPGRQLMATARALTAAGAEVLVVLLQRQGARRSPFADALADAGLACEVVPESGAFDWRLPGRIGAVIDRFAPHVVETHSYKMTAVMWLLRRRGVRVPWVGVFHGRTQENRKVRAYHWLDERMLAAADRVIGMSEVHRAEFAARGVRVDVIHNAVVPMPRLGAPVDVTAFRAPHRDGAAAPLVGVIGRLSPEKGVDVFLDACARLRAQGESFAAVVAGDGIDRDALEARRSALGLDATVHFLGPVARVDALYTELDLVVLPSRSEGLPNVLLEALAADVPVVATRVGAVPEVLDGEPDAGHVVAPEDPEALAAAMRQMWRRSADPRAHEARQRVAARFSLERRIDALLDLYTGARRAAR